MTQHCVLMYGYRDAANYKAHGEVLLQGNVDQGALRRIQSRLESGEWFIAEQVGVPALYESLCASSGSAITDDLDHVWHELYGIREAKAEDLSRLTVWGSAAEFVARMDSIDDWCPQLSPNWLL